MTLLDILNIFPDIKFEIIFGMKILIIPNKYIIPILDKRKINLYEICYENDILFINTQTNTNDYYREIIIGDDIVKSIYATKERIKEVSIIKRLEKLKLIL